MQVTPVVCVDSTPVSITSTGVPFGVYMTLSDGSFAPEHPPEVACLWVLDIPAPTGWSPGHAWHVGVNITLLDISCVAASGSNVRAVTTVWAVTVLLLACAQFCDLSAAVKVTRGSVDIVFKE